MTTQAVESHEGKTKTETRYWECSVCKHQEWAAPGDYQHYVANPPPMLGGTWRFKDRVDPIFCVCQKRTDKEHKDRKIAEYATRTMRLYKSTVWLGPNESLPNVGIKVSLQDVLAGKDPSEEKPLDQKPEAVQAVAPVLVPQGVAAKAPEGDPSESVAVDDPDALFGKEKGE